MKFNDDAPVLSIIAAICKQYGVEFEEGKRLFEVAVAKRSRAALRDAYARGWQNGVKAPTERNEA